MASIYENSVEKKIEIEDDDIFDDVFGQDEEKKKSKEIMKQKAKEISEKQKKEESKNKEEDKKSTDDDDEDDTEYEEEKSTEEEPELFLDTDQIKEIKKKSHLNDKQKEKEFKIKTKTKFDRTKSDFDEQVEEGLENSIKKGLGGGKLELKIHEEEEDESEFDEENNYDVSEEEHNIIKSVIKNKSEKAVEDDDEVAEYLFKEHGTKEEIEAEEDKKKIEDEKELIENETNDEDLEEIEEEEKPTKKGKIKESDPNDIKPKLELLMSQTNHAYIGRKKSILKSYGDEAGLFVGRIEEDTMKHTPVYLDGLNPHVVFVCGARGSGKSYVLGVLAEELALKNKNVGIVVVDPIGVFWSMKHPNRENKELELLAQWNIMPQGLDNIKVFIPVGMKSSVPKSTFDQTFSIQPSLLTAEDWCLTFGIERFSPTGLLLDKAIAKVKSGYTTLGDEPKKIRGKQNTFSLQDLIDCFEFDSELNDRDKGYKADSIRALISRFDAAKSWGIFDENGTPLSILSRAGQMTILDTSFLEDNVSALVIGILSRRLLQARKISTRRESSTKFETEASVDDLIELNVPPTWLFIDEAHTLIPGGNQKTPASNALVEYVKQGRRPGLSLVFATQQPSAIDSKVLSQLDVIMSHKLVFDDDVKSIYKRTPTIIPMQYKRPNFIKTMPVGIALTGDRQETTSRAFVMGIRPRMSQHEGRDAETTEIKHDLDEDQVENLAVNIILNQLQKDPSIALISFYQTLDTLNNTYQKNVAPEKILGLLSKKGIKYDDKKIYGEGVLEEIEAEKEMEANKELEENSEVIEEEKDPNKVDSPLKLGQLPKAKMEKQEFSQGVELVSLKSQIDESEARIRLANLRLKKKLFLFGEEEILDRLELKYGILYKIKYNYFSQKDTFQIGEAYINSITGEFIHDINGELKESNGLIFFIDLNENESEIIKYLNGVKSRTLTSIAKHMSMDKGNAKRIIDKLIIKKYVYATKDEDQELTYYLNLNLDLPPNPLHTILSSIGKRPITEVESVSIIPAKLKEEEAVLMLNKFWKNIKIKKVTNLFIPIWEGILKKKTGEERIEYIDGINGKQLKSRFN
ncbi:MAG: DUF87 domain-containing protein [Candidatus ainarchaeum sp.]|nr:DUF87 domain-containing protein [Candidatus ainarchaeum sp.]